MPQQRLAEPAPPPRVADAERARPTRSRPTGSSRQTDAGDLAARARERTRASGRSAAGRAVAASPRTSRRLESQCLANDLLRARGRPALAVVVRGDLDPVRLRRRGRLRRRDRSPSGRSGGPARSRGRSSGRRVDRERRVVERSRPATSRASSRARVLEPQRARCRRPASLGSRRWTSPPRRAARGTIESRGRRAGRRARATHAFRSRSTRVPASSQTSASVTVRLAEQRERPRVQQREHRRGRPRPADGASRRRDELVERVGQRSTDRAARGRARGSAFSPSRLIQTVVSPSSVAGATSWKRLCATWTWCSRSAVVSSKKRSQCPWAGLYEPTSSAVTTRSNGTPSDLSDATIRARSVFERMASFQPRRRSSSSAARHLGERRPVRQRAAERARSPSGIASPASCASRSSVSVEHLCVAAVRLGLHLRLEPVVAREQLVRALGAEELLEPPRDARRPSRSACRSSRTSPSGSFAALPVEVLEVRGLDALSRRARGAVRAQRYPGRGADSSRLSG